MKRYRFVYSLIFLITVFFTLLIVKNIFWYKNAPHTLYKFIDQNICFYLGPDTQLDIHQDSFSYKAGKNKGVFYFQAGQVDPKLKFADFGEFKGGYRKLVNKRISQMQIAPNLLLVGELEIIKAYPPPPNPLRQSCSVLAKKNNTQVKEFLIQNR